MKKIGLLLVLIAMVVLAGEHDTWYWDNNGWVYQQAGNPQALARAWGQYPTGGACNKRYWGFDFTTSVSMAQWIEWSISSTEWKWKVRKVGPNLCQQEGWYATDCITLWIKSNYDVDITFSGFGHLYNPTSIDQYIEAYYCLGSFNLPPPKDDTLWIPAPALNNLIMHLVDSEALHGGLDWKFWNMIHVTNCNSACEYTNTGTIILELKMIKPWIDPATGYFLQS